MKMVFFIGSNLIDAVRETPKAKTASTVWYLTSERSISSSAQLIISFLTELANNLGDAIPDGKEIHRLFTQRKQINDMFYSKM